MSKTFTTAPTPDQPGRWVISKFGPPSVLQWETFDDGVPSPPPGSALVRILAAGIGGTDNIQRAGGYPNPRCEKPGFTPGYDFVGEVVSLGSPDELLGVGDRVASMCMIGAHATHIVLPTKDLIQISPDDDIVKVCALPLNYMTAFGMLKRAGVDLQPGSSVLLGSAAGGIGTAAAQLVKAFEMDLQLIGTCSPSKFDYVRSLGVIPVDRNHPELWKVVRSLSRSRKGVDAAYDAVGSPESLEQSHKSLKDGSGKLVGIGIMGDIANDGSGMATRLTAEEIMQARILPQMTFWGVDREYYRDTRDVWLQDFNDIIEKVRNRELDPKIAQCLPLSDAVRAHEEIISGKGVLGKMIFVVDGEKAELLGLKGPGR